MKMLASACLILLSFSISNLVVDVSFVSGQSSEKELLLDLRNNLVYDASVSTKLVHWSESIDFCGWAGVECDSKGRVSGLDLSEELISDGINGADSSLFRLTHLQSLSLAQNTFYNKEMPLGFGQLTELRYLNLSYSGFSGQIPSDLSNLTRLVSLDLTNSGSLLNIPDLRGLIQSYTRLRELYLDGVNISANGEEWGSAISSSLPNLRVLSMSSSFLTGPFHPSLQKLQSLSHIRLDGNSFSSPFPEFLSGFPNLKVLTLSFCDLYGAVPRKLFHIKTMQRIILHGNENLGGSLPEFPVNGSLQELILGGPKFTGTLPESIGNLRMLTRLVAFGSNISGPIPSTIRNLKRLVELDLSENRLSGPIPSFALLKNLTSIDLSWNRLTGQIPDSLWKGLDSLGNLDLSSNHLVGEIPSSLFLLPELYLLNLFNNSFSGFAQVPANVLSPLGSLILSRNKLEGSVPRVLFELPSLSLLDLSDNKFNGTLELTDFHKLTNLSELDLSYNYLSLHVNEEVSLSSLLPQLSALNLASCKMQKLPNLKNHSSLSLLDLSDNELDGPIPNWMWQINNGKPNILKLSGNRFSRLQEPYNLSYVFHLDLHDNMLVGEIPMPLSGAEVLDFSGNRFSSFPPSHNPYLLETRFFSAADNEITGEIPLSFCNLSTLQVLDLSNNGFTGRIPSCLMKDLLEILNLRANNLDGDIPDAFPVGCSLETLDLSRNPLQGKLPISLSRCSHLKVLDLTSNGLNDAIPCWLEALSKLRVLVLRSNMFHGNISCLGEATSSWRDLQILDFASNNISGVMPAGMFRNQRGFMADGTQQQHDILQLSVTTASIVYYQDSVTVTMKGLDYKLEKILRIFTAIDLSSNHLEGGIPEEIGELRSIRVLNLSHNALSGHIPSSMGNLKELESLDLSFNTLGGEVPQQLADLTFLSFLNLSHNHLAGRIPRGSQFQTFNESSFAGNEGLCGFPVRKKCSGDEGPLPAFPEEEYSDSYSVGEIYASAAWGFLVGLGFFVGPLLLWRRWRSYYSKLLTRIVLLLLCRQNHARQR